MVDTGTQYDSLKFRAEATRMLAFIAGTPFGIFITQVVFTGMDLGWIFIFRLFAAMLSVIACDFLLKVSYNDMKLRDWCLERSFRRTQP